MKTVLYPVRGRRKYTSILILILSAVLMITSFPSSYAATTTKKTTTPTKIDTSDAAIKALEDKLKKLETDQKSLEKKIAAAKSNITDEMQYKSYLDNQIKLTDEDISTTDELIIKYQNKIRDTEDEIAAKEDDISVKFKILKERLKLSYENGNVTYLEMILSTDNFSDFLMTAERIGRMVDYEIKLMNELNDQATQLKGLRESLNVSKTAEESALDGLEAKKNKLTQLSEESADYIANQQSTAAWSEKQLDEIIAQQDKIDKEIEALLVERQRQLNAMYVGGSMGWPVDIKYKRVSSPFGYREFDRAVHTGIDIPVDYGAAVYAANAGTVVTATYHYSYGYYVLIDHGGGIATLYAHNSVLLVSAGDKVKAGQQIAKAGSTGVSYGNHCHFEVRKNGVAVNPLDGYVGVPN